MVWNKMGQFVRPTSRLLQIVLQESLRNYLQQAFPASVGSFPSFCWNYLENLFREDFHRNYPKNFKISQNQQSFYFFFQKTSRDFSLSFRSPSEIQIFFQKFPQSFVHTFFNGFLQKITMNCKKKSLKIFLLVKKLCLENLS